MERIKRAINEPLRRRAVDSSASSCSVLQTLHNDAAESTVRGHNGSQNARSRTPYAHRLSGARMECAN
eukprot:5436602-Lingulodinium_polyedra.AAC.1